MSDPTVSNVRVTAVPLPPDEHPAPAEGLPPGVREAYFDGRLALFFPKRVHGEGGNRLVLGTAGKLFQCHYAEGSHHEMVNPRIQELEDSEIEAAFERGAEWVRTGEMA